MSLFRRATGTCPGCGCVVRRDVGERAVTARAKTAEVKCPACAATWQASLDPAWWFTFRTEDGRLHRKRYGASKRGALDAGAAVKTDIARGTFVNPRKRCKVTVGAAVEAYYRAVASVKSAAACQREQGNLQHLTAFLGNERLLDKITSADFHAYQLQAAAKFKPSTIMRACHVLSSVLRHAVERGWLQARPKVPGLRYDNRRQTFLARGQVATLAEWLQVNRGAVFGDLVLYLASTGCRRNEALLATWDWVDLQRKHVNLPASVTKARRGRAVPLNQTALEVLERRKADADGPFVFQAKGEAIPTSTWTHCWNAATAGCGIKARTHDLRHTCASLLAERGESLLTIAAVLGHQDTKVTMRYAHLVDAHLARAMEGATIGATTTTTNTGQEERQQAPREPAQEELEELPEAETRPSGDHLAITGEVIPFRIAANS